MKLAITMFRDEDGWIVVECPAIPGCASQGRTEDEAIENIKDAIAVCLEARRDAGLPLTIDTREVEVPALA
jgi:predicted RNase H-like HicB family nuclease